MDRRAYLTAATAVVAAGAGCIDTMSLDDGGDENDDDADDDDLAPEWVDDEMGTVQVFDDFTDLDEWDAAVGDVDSDDEGDGSAVLTVEEDDDQVRIVREFDEPLDVSGLHPGLTAATDAATDPVVQLYDTDGNRLDFGQSIAADVPPTRYPLGISGIDGVVDLGEIEQLQIVYWLGEESEGRLWIDDLHFVPRVERGIVLFLFEGGFETHASEALELLDAHDMQGTTFVPTERIREDSDAEGSRLTESQVVDLVDSGWIVGSYAAHGGDLTDLDDREPDEEIESAREWLEDVGLGRSAPYFAFPAGNYDETTLEIASDNHELAFAGNGAMCGEIATPSLCSRVPGPDERDALELLELTATLGGITCLSYFQLEDEALESLEAAVEYAAELRAEGDIEIALPPDLGEYVR